MSVSRREQVINLLKAGLIHAEIGRSLGLSKQRIGQIYKEKKPIQEFDVMLSLGEVARMLVVKGRASPRSAASASVVRTKSPLRPLYQTLNRTIRSQSTFWGHSKNNMQSCDP
jgi:hypothetical protein